MSHAALRRRADASQAKKLASIDKHDKASDTRMVKRAMSQHEAHDHKGQPKTKLKLADGGVADGDMAPPRLDRASKRSGSSKKSSKGPHVNVVVANSPKEKEPVPMPIGGLGGLGAPKPPLAPPPAPPPALAGAGGPPGLPPRPPLPPVAAGAPPMMPHKHGGRAGFARGGPVMKAGSKSGEGRLEKISAQKREDKTFDREEHAEGGMLKRGGKAD